MLIPLYILLLLTTVSCTRDRLYEDIRSVDVELRATNYRDTNVWRKLSTYRDRVIAANDERCDTMYNRLVFDIMERGSVAQHVCGYANGYFRNQSALQDVALLQIGHSLRHSGNFLAAHSTYVAALHSTPSKLDAYGNLAMEYHRIGLTRVALVWAKMADSVCQVRGSGRDRLWTSRLLYQYYSTLGYRDSAVQQLPILKRSFETLVSSFSMQGSDTVTCVNLIHSMTASSDFSSDLAYVFGKNAEYFLKMHDYVTSRHSDMWIRGWFVENAHLYHVPKPVIRRMPTSVRLDLWADSIVADVNGNPCLSTRFGTFQMKGTEYRLATPRHADALVSYGLTSRPVFDTILTSSTGDLAAFTLSGDTILATNGKNAFVCTAGNVTALRLPEDIVNERDIIDVMSLDGSRMLIQTPYRLFATLLQRDHSGFRMSILSSAQVPNNSAPITKGALKINDSCFLVRDVSGVLHGVRLRQSPFQVGFTKVILTPYYNLVANGAVPGYNRLLNQYWSVTDSTISCTYNYEHYDQFSDSRLAGESEFNVIYGDKKLTVLSIDNKLHVIDTVNARYYSLLHSPIAYSTFIGCWFGVLPIGHSITRGFFSDGYALVTFDLPTTQTQYGRVLSIDSLSVRLASNHNQNLQDIELVPGQRYTISTATIGATSNWPLHYRFNHSGSWYSATNHRTYREATVSPSATDTVLVLHDPILNLTCEIPIRVPFWKRAEIRFVSMTVLVVLLGLIIRGVLRKRRQRRQAYVDRVKDQQISLLREDMHDVIGSRLVRIASLARRASTRNDPHTLERIHDLSVTTVRSLRNVLSLLSESDLSDGEFFGTLREFVSESCRDVDMPCTLDIDTINTSHLTRNQRHELLMIITELMSNTLRHSQASMVFFTVRQQSEKYTLTWRDNGKGIDPNSPQGNGHNNVKRRIQRINAQVSMQTGSGQGTSFTITIPIK
ncbi:MAG: hypothetical protein RIR53_1757 [Bacteroidota bacterium]